MQKHLSLLAAGALLAVLSHTPAMAAPASPAPSKSPVAAPASPAPAKSTAPASAASAASADDKKFIMAGAQGNMAEIALGKIAQKNAGSAAVKSAGAQMVTDHGKILASIKSLAKAQGVTLPAAPNATQQALATKLQKLTGAAFDKAYVAAMVDDHKKDIADHKKKMASTKDAALKTAIGQALPIMEKHLTLFEGLAKK